MEFIISSQIFKWNIPFLYSAKNIWSFQYKQFLNKKKSQKPSTAVSFRIIRTRGEQGIVTWSAATQDYGILDPDIWEKSSIP